jgi:hypothetical protein
MLAGLPVALFTSWYLSRHKPEEDDDLQAVPDKKASGLPFTNYAGDTNQDRLSLLLRMGAMF